MPSITIKEDKCIVDLNKEFYPESIIKKGIEQFKGAKKIELSTKGKVFITTTKKADLEEIGYEFCDFLLTLIQGGNEV
ncbi:MAG: HxsD-like protein [Nanoarchaeota archaeon]|nr:HxsD-like protein [Nanoarchaeota archaeon]MBU1031107.1 HxsD-like protein [Nanoarchaeota archaeon]MBU1849118.1 HxsD-like protein [Nanoarchaeota archaeon]